MDEEPNPGRDALVVWLKLAGLLAVLAVFGALVFWLRRTTLPR